MPYAYRTQVTQTVEMQLDAVRLLFLSVDFLGRQMQALYDVGIRDEAGVYKAQTRGPDAGQIEMTLPLEVTTFDGVIAALQDAVFKRLSMGGAGDEFFVAPPAGT